MFHSRYLVIAGGVDHAFLYADAWVFDLETLTWTELAQTGDVPTRRRSAVHFQHSLRNRPGEDYGFVYGGEWYDDPPANALAMFKFKFVPGSDSLKWQQCHVTIWRTFEAKKNGYGSSTGFSNIFMGCSFALLPPSPDAPPRLYVFNGINRNPNVEKPENFTVLQFDFCYFDSNTKTEKFQPSNVITCNVFHPSVQIDLPCPRLFGSAVTLHGKVYLFGGHFDDPSPDVMADHIPENGEWFVDDIAIFEGVDWVRGGGVPGPALANKDLSSSKFILWDKLILGEADSSVAAPEYDFLLERNGQTAVALGDKILVIGGGNYSKLDYRSDVLVIGSPEPSPIERHVRFAKGSMGGDLGSSERIGYGNVDLTTDASISLVTSDGVEVGVAKAELETCGMFKTQFSSSFSDASADRIDIDFDAATTKACVTLLSQGANLPLPPCLMQPLEEMEGAAYECFSLMEFCDFPESAWVKMENWLGLLLSSHAEKEIVAKKGGEAAAVFERIAREGGLKLLLVTALYYIALSGGGGGKSAATSMAIDGDSACEVVDKEAEEVFDAAAFKVSIL
jgi:hypothetical protein